MTPLFQQFQFRYADGDLFFDRSGTLARKLKELHPDLERGEARFDQRDFSVPNKDLEMFFGTSVAAFKSYLPGDEGFPSMAAEFSRAVSSTFEITDWSWFSFRLVLGKPCASYEEAHSLLMPLVPEEWRKSMVSVAALPQWNSFQAEYVEGSFAFETKFAILDLRPHPSFGLAATGSGDTVPHVTFHFEAKGRYPISVSDFDPKSFIDIVRDSQSGEVLAKIAPFLSSL
jgi:hypothetical protein